MPGIILNRENLIQVEHLEHLNISPELKRPKN
jgi:hypothetical protein